MTVSAPPVGDSVPNTALPERLGALSRAVAIAGARRAFGGFGDELLDEAHGTLNSAAERLRLSATHTVVALAGGTGSGKSSLFNALAGAEFSPAAATRPATREAHACVWGMAGAAPLLDWLDVRRHCRYARASALDAGETTLSGLLLLDLPDHDSVLAGAAVAMDRLVDLADVMVWVLDPQKYADAAVHSRYLADLAQHAPTTTVVLNQCDRLTPEQVRDCETDLRRLLDAEGLTEARLLCCSAVTGAGLDGLRAVLADAVATRNAATRRIAADVDALAERFAHHAGAPLPAGGGRHDRTRYLPWDGLVTGDIVVPLGSPVASELASSVPAVLPQLDTAGTGTVHQAGTGPNGSRGDDVHPDGSSPDAGDALDRVPAGPVRDLADAFARAAAVTAVTDTVQDVRELHAARYLYWPPARLAGRCVALCRGGARRPADLVGAPPAEITGGAEADRPVIDAAVTAFAAAVGGPLPLPWPATVRAAARSRSGEIAAALGAAVGACLPPRRRVPSWWKLARVVQWALAGLAVVGLVWLCLVAAFGVFDAARHPPSALLDNTSLLPWLGAVVVALLLLGWVTARGCRSLVAVAADRERQRTDAAMRTGVDAVAQDFVALPVAGELAAYDSFLAAVAAARTPRPAAS